MWFWPRPTQTQRALTQAGATSPAESGGTQAAATQAALTREVAGVASDLHAQLETFLGVRPNRDPLLASQQPSGAYAYPYGLFEEALDKDAHLSAICSQRKAAVLAWDRRLDPADGSAPAR